MRRRHGRGWTALLAAAVAAGGVACVACGAGDTAGGGLLRIKLVNNWYATDGQLLVLIDTCNQEFTIPAGGQHIVENCAPGPGLSSVLVRIEGRIVGVSYIGDGPNVWEGQVADGETVTITGEINRISVAVER